ncbi:glutathione reductase (NADPH) [Weissella uvarum]|uniref:dihydrolipoyl dehydrogenase family protein n=1 Tax=Weissella uvarum TaxID=1479233 RepID=UPI001960ABE8|nr:NAD(P)/FAD-dependent oxidoreductase [Weissella uvarum]MBM7616556.1 glutathione reductase (NADPH) [Weissella uvarum]MCM0594984.1 NAD(P)/FAD-dependent oxidoreductase [Weissella uvarum]
MVQYDYDVVIIGGGPAGQQVAYGLAEQKRILIIEKDLWGGTCPNRGCDPKKMLYGVVEAKRQTEAFQNKGLQGVPEIDWAAMMAFKQSYTDQIPSGTEAGLRHANIHHNHGTARLLSDHALDLDGEEISADKIVIATGATAAKPEIPGQELLETSDDFLNQTTKPKQIALIGAGYVAIELANIAVSAGVTVHIFQHNHAILGGQPQAYTDELTELLTQKGIIFHWDSDVTAVEKQDRSLVVETNQETVAGFDHVYSAMGRPANVADLDLAVAGVKLAEHGGIQVNDYLQTTAANIYAVGDVAASPAPKLTPVAGIEGRYVAQVLSGKIDKPIQYPTIAHTVFAGPELAQVGVPLVEAQAHPDRYVINDQQLGAWYTYMRMGDAHAKVSVITDKQTGIIVGAVVLATNAEEVINYFAEMIGQQQSADVLQTWVPVYPSAASDLTYLY